MFPFVLLDVFATAPYTGNQLAVVFDAQKMSAARMQQIAREFNFEESTFVVGEEGDRFDVRVFSPHEELPFAGHPTLGTAFAISCHQRMLEPTKCMLRLKIGDVPVDVSPSRDGSWGTAAMIPPPVTLGKTWNHQQVAVALSLSGSDIDTSLPIVSAEVGLEFVLIPLKTRDALRRLQLHSDAFQSLVAEGMPSWAYAFCYQPPDSTEDVAARMVWLDGRSMREDAATGSAGSCLANYLLAHRIPCCEDWEIDIQQGCEIGRPSVIQVRCATVNGTSSISIGGQVHAVAEGVIR